MRLSAALSALLLHTVPVTAQSTSSSTTDVNYPTILSAAGNLTGLPGGNTFCGSSRVRKPWGALTSSEQALYLEATEKALADGGVADFAAIAAETLGQAQGEYSCGFFMWHRRFLLAYESYLRDLDDRFACVTLPYYDVHTSYIQAVNGECTNMFDCSGIFNAIGGATNSTRTTQKLDGVTATGYAVTGAPYNACIDDDCDYVVRENLSTKSIPSAASFGSFQSVVGTSGDYATFLEGIQYGVHNEVLDAVGGVLATAAAARDVLYYSWYSALDMYLHVYHLCRIGVPVTYDQIVESLELFANSTQTCGGDDGVNADSAIIMRITVDGDLVDVSQHPTLGQYFGYVGSDNWNYVDIQQLGDYAYTYQLPEMLRQQVLSNNDMCTGFNRAFAASYTVLDANAIKSSTKTKTTTKTTTTKTTKIVNGKKVTTTKVTKVVTRSNSTTASSAASTVTSGQLVSSYSYSYLGNFSTNNVAYGEGTIVTNGYTGYVPYYTNGEITTKHNGIISANFSSTSSSSTSSSTSSRMDSTYSNTSNIVADVTVGSTKVSRNITASVATAGSYWAWQQNAYNGLFTRFNGNLDLVATHMMLLECYTFNSVYGLSNLTSSFVTNKNLITNRIDCSQRLDLVRSGMLRMAVTSKSYSASSLSFASSSTIKSILSSYKRTTTRQVSYVRKSYIQKVQSKLESTEKSLDNITAVSVSGSGSHETSTTTMDTGYITSKTTMSTVQSAANSSAVTTTTSSTTTTTTAANTSDTIDEASSSSSSSSSTTVTSGTNSNSTSSTTKKTTIGNTTNSSTTSSGTNTSTTNSGTSTTNSGTTTTGNTTTSGNTTTGKGAVGTDESTASSTGQTSQTDKKSETTSTEMTTPAATPAATTTSSSTDQTTTSETSTTKTPAPTPAATSTTTTTSSTPAPTKPTATEVTPSPTPAATTTSSSTDQTTTSKTSTTKTPAPTPAATSTTTTSSTPAPTKPTATEVTPSPTPAATTQSKQTCINVSVEADATYCIEGPICSGSGDSPAGSLCPQKGDVAVGKCHDYLMSYTNDKSCVAPEDAVCMKIKTGAWGCVFKSSTTQSTPAPTTMNTKSSTSPTPAPTTESTSTTTTPAPTVMKDEDSTSTQQTTPAPTTMNGKTSSKTTTTDSPTPCPTTYAPSTETPTPCPTTAGPSTEAPTPCPTIVKSSTEAATPSPTTIKQTDETQTTKTGVSSETQNQASQSSNNQDVEQQVQQQSSSSTKTVTTLATDDTTSTATSSGSSLSAGAVVGIVAALCAVVAVAGFAVYKKGQGHSSGDLHDDIELSPQGFYNQPITPETRSTRL